MNRALRWKRYFVFAASAALTMFKPSHGWTADPAVLPWDYTFNAIQNFVGGPLSHLVIVVAASCAVLSFTLAGDNPATMRLFGGWPRQPSAPAPPCSRCSC